MGLVAPPRKRKPGMIPPARLNPFQFGAGDGQGKGRGARAWDPWEVAGQGMLLHQEQGRNRHSRGWSPKQVLLRGTGFFR